MSGVVLAILLLAVSIHAQGIGGMGGLNLPLNDQAEPDRPRVLVETELQQTAATAGQYLDLAVILDIAEGFHINSNTPGVDTLIPTEVRLQADRPGVRVGMAQYPEGQQYTVGEGPTAITADTFFDRPVILVPIHITENVQPGEVTLSGTVTYQACDHEVCYAPETEDIRVTLQIVEELPTGFTPSDAEYFIDRDDEALFTEQYAKLQRLEAADMDVPDDGSPRSLDATTSSEVSASDLATPGTGLTTSLLTLIGTAILGGLVLNLTPCVLPVIPIKVMTISQHAGTRGRTFYLGMWMALGVISFWVGIGLPVAFLSGFGDPSALFGIWWVTFGIGLLIAIMGVGIMGMFTFNLPQSVYAINPRADTAWGSYAFGIMTAILGLPCFGFVAGAMLVGLATMPSMHIVMVFLGMGVGMASPYLVLSAFPKLVDSIPRTGPASELVKQVMGLLMLAAAAYFIGSGLIALVLDAPYIGKQLHIWLIALFTLAAGVWLVRQTFRITPNVTRRIIFTLVGMALVIPTFWYATSSTRTARENYMISREAMREARLGNLITTTWMDYEPGMIEKALEQDYTVILDFTAEWCLNCKALKATVLDVDPVKSRLTEDDIVMIKVDLTSRSQPGWDLMAEYGQTGIPLLMILDPDQREPWMANRYTSRQVLTALEQITDHAETAADDPARTGS